MILAMLLGAFLGGMIHATDSHKECKEMDFKPKACVTSKLTDKAGKFLEKL